MSDLIHAYLIAAGSSAVLATGALFIGVMNGSLEGWRRQDYRFAFSALAAFVAAPVWPLTLVALLIFFYRRAFPKPTPEDLDERIRRAEREAGIA